MCDCWRSSFLFTLVLFFNYLSLFLTYFQRWPPELQWHTAAFPLFSDPYRRQIHTSGWVFPRCLSPDIWPSSMGPGTNLPFFGGSLWICRLSKFVAILIHKTFLPSFLAIYPIHPIFLKDLTKRWESTNSLGVGFDPGMRSGEHHIVSHELIILCEFHYVTHFGTVGKTVGKSNCNLVWWTAVWNASITRKHGDST